MGIFFFFFWGGIKGHKKKMWGRERIGWIEIWHGSEHVVDTRVRMHLNG